MAWTSVGFDGTINEAQWASLSGLLGNDYVAAGNSDCVVTAVGGARSVSVAAGSLYGDGVLSTNSGAETVAMTTPVNGQWYVIALRRTWATNTAALVAIAGATTTTTTPTAPPTSFPTLNTNKGVLTDQPIAWAWCNSANTTVVVYDIRLKAVKSLPPVVANANERDAKFMTPTQGLQVWRDDLGLVQTYFGLYNVSTNPGGRDVAGWYSNDRLGGLIPVRPSSAVIATGTGSANSMGVISFSGASSVSLNDCFTDEYANYRVIAKELITADASTVVRLRAAGTDVAGVGYYTQTQYSDQNGQGSSRAAAASGFPVTITNVTHHSQILDIIAPKISGSRTRIMGTTESDYNAANNVLATTRLSGYIDNTSAFDGLTFVFSQNATGTIQVFGWND